MNGSPESASDPNATEANDVTPPKGCACNHEVPRGPGKPSPGRAVSQPAVPHPRRHDQHSLSGRNARMCAGGGADGPMLAGIAPTGQTSSPALQGTRRYRSGIRPEPVAGRSPTAGTGVYHPNGSKELWRGRRARPGGSNPDGRPELQPGPGDRWGANVREMGSERVLRDFGRWSRTRRAYLPPGVADEYTSVSFTLARDDRLPYRNRRQSTCHQKGPGNAGPFS